MCGANFLNFEWRVQIDEMLLKKKMKIAWKNGTTPGETKMTRNGLPSRFFLHLKKLKERRTIKNIMRIFIVQAAISYCIHCIHATGDASKHDIDGPNLRKIISDYLGFFRDAVSNVHFQPYKGYIDGSQWPPPPSLTMLGQRRLDNFVIAVQTVIHEKIPGHVVETGVWRGGASMLAAKTIEILGESKRRKVYFCDSFQGIPKIEGKTVNKEDATAWKLEILNKNNVESVIENSVRFGINNSHVVFVKGYFNESLPKLLKSEPNITFSILRMDGDTYISTMDAIKTLYPRLNKGGFVIVDDYMCWVGCKAAIDEYRLLNNITEPITMVPHKDGEVTRGVFWRKGVSNEEMPYCPGASKVAHPRGAYTPRMHVEISPSRSEVTLLFRKSFHGINATKCI